MTRKANAYECEYDVTNYEGSQRDDIIDYQYDVPFDSNQDRNYYDNQRQHPLNKQYSDENEPLSYNSRPQRRALPQIGDK